MSEGKKYAKGMCPTVQALSEENKNGTQNATIYIHVPFCNKICSFCNMRRSLQRPSEDYADLVVQEILAYAALPYIKTTVFDAVYFGGGTPTTLETDDLCKIVKTLKENLSFTEHAEFTVETTVTELTDEKMERLIKEGVNRFSVGVQTFDESGRKQMGRIGSGKTAYERLKRLKSFPGVTVSMDLIYNYPGQTMGSLYRDLDQILELGLDGFSMYSLIDMKEASIAPAQDEKNDEHMFFAIASYMKQAGYRFLELTKMVRSDRYAYIMNRHQGADTLPLGAGAGGSVNHLAAMNPIELDKYRSSVQEFEKRMGVLFVPEYDEIVRFKGALQTARMPREDIYPDQKAYEKFRQQLLEHEMIRKDEEGYALTEKGIFWGNTISRELSLLI